MGDIKNQQWFLERMLFLRDEVVDGDKMIWIISHPDYQWERGKSYEVFRRSSDNNFVYVSSHETEEEAKNA